MVPVWEYLGETLADTDHLVPVRVCWREVENEFDRSLGRSNIISNHYADYGLSDHGLQCTYIYVRVSVYTHV